jgi:hypothetical protein
MATSVPIKASTWGAIRAKEAVVIKLEFYSEYLISRAMRHPLRVFKECFTAVKTEKKSLHT